MRCVPELAKQPLVRSMREPICSTPAPLQWVRIAFEPTPTPLSKLPGPPPSIGLVCCRGPLCLALGRPDCPIQISSAGWLV